MCGEIRIYYCVQIICMCALVRLYQYIMSAMPLVGSMVCRNSSPLIFKDYAFFLSAAETVWCHIELIGYVLWVAGCMGDFK